MPRRKPKILSRAVEELMGSGALKTAPLHDLGPMESPKPKTRAEEIYDLIDDACSFCWRFTDAEGRPWIQKEDVEDRGHGIFVVRFRCSVLAMVCTTNFERMAAEVCSRLKAKVRYAFEQREERYIGNVKTWYDECVWVIQEGETEEKVAEDENVEDETTTEDIGERFDEVMANFV